jgi:hypothetical protein
MRNRIEERETIFPSLSYELVPHDIDLPETELENFASIIIESDISKFAIAEQNFAFFLRNMYGDWRVRCEQLVADLSQYLDKTKRVP